MKVGITAEHTVTVSEDMLANKAGSGSVAVFSTPRMIAEMEGTAYRSVQPLLEAGKTTVGIKVDIRHTDATPLGMKVFIHTELTEISENGKILTFKVEARDKQGIIGSGMHERAIIDIKRFMEKVNTKK